jgi:hypothetical protein
LKGYALAVYAGRNLNDFDIRRRLQDIRKK